MNIIESAKLVQLDKNIKLKRRSNDCEITLESEGTLYSISHYGIVRFRLPIEEILAEDWYVVKNEKLHTFEEALEAYKSGKNICRKGYGIQHNKEYCNFGKDDVLANDWVILDT